MYAIFYLVVKKVSEVSQQTTNQFLLLGICKEDLIGEAISVARLQCNVCYLRNLMSEKLNFI